MTTRERPGVERCDRAEGVDGDEGERAPRVATAGGVSKGGSSRGGSRKQGQTAVDRHKPGDAGAGDGPSQGPLRRLQPLASDRAVGRAGGRPPLSLHRPAGPAGGRCSESPPPPSAQALSAPGALPPGGHAAADRREQARLVGGSGTPDAHRGRGRRHGDGPLRPIQRTGGRPRLLMLKGIIDRRGVPMAL